MSSTQTNCQEFKDIVALGPQAVPLLMKTMRSDRSAFSLSTAVAQITKARISRERWPAGSYGSSTQGADVYQYWWTVDRKNTPLPYQELKRKWDTLKQSENVEKTDFGSPLLWTDQMAYDAQSGTLLEYPRRHITELGKVYFSLRDLGIDVLPLIVKDIEAGYYDYIPIFVELTGVDTGGEWTTAPQRARIIIDRWKDHQDEWTIPDE